MSLRWRGNIAPPCAAGPGHAAASLKDLGLVDGERAWADTCLSCRRLQTTLLLPEVQWSYDAFFSIVRDGHGTGHRWSVHN